MLVVYVPGGKLVDRVVARLTGSSSEIYHRFKCIPDNASRCLLPQMVVEARGTVSNYRHCGCRQLVKGRIQISMA